MSSNMNLQTLFALFDKIEIPIIQRDYAQGRKEGKALRVRTEFISAIFEFLTNTSNTTFHLDFIYGITKNKKFVPLDGQQRLTTLFLLYWYIGKQDKISDISFLKKFTYETRISSREFSEFLIDLEYDFTCEPSVFIADQNRYTLYWRNDPTIQSMLVMLDEIHKRFYQQFSLYEKLDLIGFSFPSEEIEFNQDIYIKMNSRGKELTPFENFKAYFEDKLSRIDEKRTLEFSNKIDNEWCDLFWEYREDNDISKPFLRFFLFISEMLYFEFFVNEKDTTNRFNEISVEKLQNDGKVIIEFYNLIDQIYFNSLEHSQQALSVLFSAFDNLTNIAKRKNVANKISKDSIKVFFNQTFYTDDSDESSKINIFRDGSVDFLSRIVDDSNNTQSFKLLFYTVIKSNLRYDEYKNIYRIVRNLVINNEDMMRAEHLNKQIQTINHLLIQRKIESLKLSSFNHNHILEEQFKEKVESKFPQYTSLFMEMENHDHFWGSIRAVFNILSQKDTDEFIEPTIILERDYSKELEEIFNKIKELVGDDLNTIWGEMLIDNEMYRHEGDRLNQRYKHSRYNSNYKISSYIPLIREFYSGKFKNKDEYLHDRCRQFVKNNNPLINIECPQKQIYTMYLIHTHIHKKGYKEFFRNDNWQFGIYGDKDFMDYEDYKDEVSESPFKYKTAIQLFNKHWGSGQPFLTQPTLDELKLLEQLQIK